MAHRLRRNAEPSRPKVLMHIECLRGTGELTLASRIADALAEKGADVVIASGNARNFFKESKHIRIEKLPAIRFDDKEHKAYITDGDKKLIRDRSWVKARSEKLARVVAREKPDAMLVCYWPFGNGRDAEDNSILDKELAPLLAQLHRTQPKMPIFGSIREVIHADSQPYSGDPERAADIVNRYFTRLFVHGDPDFIPLTDNFDYTAHIRPEKIDYTGYLCSSHPEAAAAEKDTIIVTAGGGDYRPSSARLLKEALASLELVDPAFLKGKQVRLFVGQSFDKDEYRKISDRVDEAREKLKDKSVSITFGHTLPLDEFQALLPHCAMFMGQAGVGTMMDIMSYRYPAVVVPIEEKNEAGKFNFKEQYVRAKIMEKKGLLKLISQHDIDAGGGEKLLAGHINALFEADPIREAGATIRCDGARYTANAVCAAIDLIKARNQGKAAGNLLGTQTMSR